MPVLRGPAAGILLREDACCAMAIPSVVGTQRLLGQAGRRRARTA
jgi:hypothetical protein